MRNAATDSLLTGFVPRPAEARHRYTTAGLYSGTPIWQNVIDRSASSPNAVAVTDEHRSLTYTELDRATADRAAGFARAGLAPGDRMVLQNANSVAFVINLLGALRAGVAPVMALPAHRIAEISHLAASAGAVAYVANDSAAGFDYRELAHELTDRVDSVRRVFIDGEPGRFETPPDETSEPPDAAVVSDAPALLLVSGGTTGMPKLIPRTHDDYALNARTSARIAQLTPNDTYLTALPAAHNFPLCCPGILGVLGAGGHVVFTADPSPDNAFGLIEKHRVTVTALVPALAQIWCAATDWEPADVSSLRLLQVGGAKLARPDAIALGEAFGPNTVQQVFGMAEGLICYTRHDDPPDTVVTTQGRPMSDYDEVRVVDETGHDVPDGVDGELLVRGPYTIRGYYRASEHNERSFTPDGFYRSGDRVRRAPSGHLVVTGRIRDTIVRAGENVAVDDVEESLLEFPGIRQTAVVGLADDALGERICAAIVVESTAPVLSEVRAFLAGRGLASFKLPDELRIVRSLPVTAVGKVDRAALTSALQETDGGIYVS